MNTTGPSKRRTLLWGCCASAGLLFIAYATQASKHAVTSTQELPPEHAAPARQDPAVTKPPLDRTGHKRVGKASFYAKQFAGKIMSNGQPMRPHGNNAASKTLPLGTTAKVTNLETGKSAVVTIQDRGPYVEGRIVDLSEGTAKQIGLTPKDGVTEVAVTPIVVPMPDGTAKPGAAAGDAGKR